MARLQPNKHIPQVLDYEIGTLRSAARGLRQRSSDAGLMHRLDSVLLLSKYPPAKPGALTL